MDNVTHAIAGVITAEVVVQLRRRRGDDVSPARARAAWVVSALAHNAADADFLYVGLTEAPLGYLLHHRGHTHTLVLAPLMALLAYVIGGSATRAWRDGATRADRRALAALALAGAVAHILLDLSNDYGVPVGRFSTVGSTETPSSSSSRCSGRHDPSSRERRVRIAGVLERAPS